MLYKKASEMKPTPIPHCMGGEGTVSDTQQTPEKTEESMVIGSGRAVHIINGEEQILEKGDIIAAMPGDTHQIACLGDEPLVLIAQVLYE